MTPTAGAAVGTATVAAKVGMKVGADPLGGSTVVGGRVDRGTGTAVSLGRLVGLLVGLLVSLIRRL